MNPITSFFTSLISPVAEGVKEWQRGKREIKKAKIAAEVAKYQAQEKRWLALAEVEADWDMEAMRQAQYSWKDEWITIIITLPFVGAFIPEVQDFVLKGFEYLQRVPAWYMVIFMGIVAASFGLRWWFNKQSPVSLFKQKASAGANIGTSAVQNLNTSSNNFGE